MRATYRAKRDILLDAVSDLPGVHVGGVAAGLHMSLELPLDVDEAAVTGDLSGGGVFVQGLSGYRIRPGAPGLVLGYAHLTADQVRTGATLVAQVLRRHI